MPLRFEFRSQEFRWSQDIYKKMTKIGERIFDALEKKGKELGKLKLTIGDGTAFILGNDVIEISVKETRGLFDKRGALFVRCTVEDRVGIDLCLIIVGEIMHGLLELQKSGDLKFSEDGDEDEDEDND